MLKKRNSITNGKIRLTYLDTFTKNGLITFLTIREVARICFVCLKWTSDGDVSFKHAGHTM